MTQAGGNLIKDVVITISREEVLVVLEVGEVERNLIKVTFNVTIVKSRDTWLMNATTTKQSLGVMKLRKKNRFQIRFC